MIVELAGLPFSGKTTFLRRLKRALRARNVPHVDCQQMYLRQPVRKKLPSFVKNKPDRALLYYGMRFARKNPVLAHRMAEVLSPTPAKDFYFRLMGANMQAAADQGGEDEILFTDEAFVSHMTAAFLRRDNPEEVLDLAEHAPKVGAILHIQTGPETCFERAVQAAGGDAAARDGVVRKMGEPDLFVRRRELMGALLDRFANADVPIIAVDGTVPVSQSAPGIADRLQALVSPGT